LPQFKKTKQIERKLEKKIGKDVISLTNMKWVEHSRSTLNRKMLEPPKIVPISSLSSKVREYKTFA